MELEAMNDLGKHPRVRRARRGAAELWGALRLLAADPQLRAAAALPTLLTVAGCAALAAASTFIGDDESPRPFGRVGTFMATFAALASMPPTVLVRQWTRLALEARRVHGLAPGADPHATRLWLGAFFVEWRKAIRQVLVAALGLGPLLLILQLLPAGDTLAAATLGLWGFYWVVVDALELPIEVMGTPAPPAPAPWFERGLIRAGEAHFLFRPLSWAGRFSGSLARPWREQVHFTEERPWECLGFGLAVGALLAVPILGLAFRSVAIVGATALVGGLDIGLDGALGVESGPASAGGEFRPAPPSGGSTGAEALRQRL